MTLRMLGALFVVLTLFVPTLVGAVDFDRKIDAAAVVGEARKEAALMPSATAASSIGNIWTVVDTKEVALAPGQKESAYLEMQSTTYKQVCENPFPPYGGAICRDEVMFRDVLRFKLVLAEHIPAAWGKQTFRLRLDSGRRPALSIAALDRSHAWRFKLPEINEDVLVVTPTAGLL